MLTTQTQCKRGIWGEEILPNVISIELEEATVDDEIAKRLDDMKYFEREFVGLLEIHTELQAILQMQGQDLYSIEKAMEESLRKAEKGVLNLAEGGNYHASNIKMKCTLWGTGIGAAVGGVGGATVGFIGTPVLSVIAGAGGAVGGAGAGAFAGSLIGAGLESVLKGAVKNELVALGRAKNLKPDDGKCHACNATLGTLYLKMRYTCCLCGHTFCWDCCKAKIYMKYPGVKNQQLENICKICKRKVVEVTENVAEKQRLNASN